MVTHSGPLADQAAGRTLGVETGIDVKLGLMFVGLRRLVMGFSVDFHQPCGVAARAARGLKLSANTGTSSVVWWLQGLGNPACRII